MPTTVYDYSIDGAGSHDFSLVGVSNLTFFARSHGGLGRIGEGLEMNGGGGGAGVVTGAIDVAALILGGHPTLRVVIPERGNALNVIIHALDSEGVSAGALYLTSGADGDNLGSNASGGSLSGDEFGWGTLQLAGGYGDPGNDDAESGYGGGGGGSASDIAEGNVASGPSGGEAVAGSAARFDGQAGVAGENAPGGVGGDGGGIAYVELNYDYTPPAPPVSDSKLGLSLGLGL